MNNYHNKLETFETQVSCESLELYESPQAVVLQAQCEGVLCESFTEEMGPAWDLFE